MRILVAGANASIAGGAESYQRSVVEALTARGHAVARVSERPCPVGAEPVIAAHDNVPTWGADVLGYRAAGDRALAWRPDVVFSHGLASPTFEATLLAHAPGVLFAHSYYGTCATGTKRHALPGVVFCTRQIGRACLVLHYPRRCGGLNPVTMLRVYRTQMRRFALLARYRAICVASQHMAREYRRHRLPDERIHTLPLPPTGIVPDDKEPEPRFGIGRVLLVGRQTELKGGAFLVRAVATAAARLGRPLELHVIGAGPFIPRIEELARAHTVTLQCFPWLEPAQRNAAFRSAEVLAMPSLWPEPFGLVGLEAACVGLPTVAFSAGGIPDWLSPGETGELAPAAPPTANRFADALVRALCDPQHYARLAHGAWRRAHEYSMESHLRRLTEVLHVAAHA